MVSLFFGDIDLVLSGFRGVFFFVIVCIIIKVVNFVRVKISFFILFF